MNIFNKLLILLCLSTTSTCFANTDLRNLILEALKKSQPISSSYTKDIVGEWSGTCVSGIVAIEIYLNELDNYFNTDGSIKEELSFSKLRRKIYYNNRRISTKAERLTLTISTLNGEVSGLAINQIMGLNLITEITHFTLFNKIANVPELPPLDPFIEISDNRSMAVYPVSLPNSGRNLDQLIDLRILNGSLYTFSRFKEGEGAWNDSKNLDIICKLHKQ